MIVAPEREVPELSKAPETIPIRKASRNVIPPSVVTRGVRCFIDLLYDDECRAIEDQHYRYHDRRLEMLVNEISEQKRCYRSGNARYNHLEPCDEKYRS